MEGEDILQNKNDLDDLDHNLIDLNKIKGEKLINFETKNLKQFSLTFKSSTNRETSKPHNIFLKAHSINFKKLDNKMDNVSHQ
jgi:hypothetical protein